MLQPLLYNDHANQMLDSMIASARFPHAILLEGEEGTGRSTFARQVAMALLCQGEGEVRPCGTCSACHKVEADIHPDFITLQAEEGARSFKVDQVRQLKMDCVIRPNEGSCKVYLVKEIQMMTAEAQNAFLKTLEEPPAHCYFLLTCRNRSALLSTLLSRVRMVQMTLPTVAQCEEALRQLRPGLSPEQMERAAHVGEGAIGPALAALDAEGETQPEAAARLLGLLTGGSEYQLLVALAPYEKDREVFLQLLEELRRQVSNALVDQARGATASHSLHLTALQLLRLADIIEDTARRVDQNGNKQLLVTLLASRLKSALG